MKRQQQRNRKEKRVKGNKADKQQKTKQLKGTEKD